jgi:glycosyltransferase involved in cell wall biosynthesis
MSAAPASYSLVIATFERPDDLAVTLAAITEQIHAPAEVIVVDSSGDERTRQFCEASKWNFPVRWIHSEAKSAAMQRNQGAELANPDSEILGFVDDDITMYPQTCLEICKVFAADQDEAIGGIAVRIDEIQRSTPSRLTRFYYWLQAGYRHATYGGRLFGPAINCLPCYSEPTEESGDLIRAEWLNSGCVFYRREPFLREKFPAFDGYSFMEDVHCSARIAKTHRLYFHTRARCSHRDGTNVLKRDFAGLARQRIRNQRIVARDVMGQDGMRLAWKFLLHRLFASFTIVRHREPGWTQSLKGTWI